ncbi:hypothetical protein AQZ49_01825 [Novosphingobium sp. FSW06-99]|nr:hypothetical protein AQZ49_01825 [Novosphingobium sp. FSW06-99]
MALIRAHYFRAMPCSGAGNPPIEKDDRFLEASIAQVDAERSACAAEIQQLRRARANWIDPRIAERVDELDAALSRLRRRLQHNRSWPLRFERQMRTQGWGTPPPPYLLAQLGASA